MTEDIKDSTGKLVGKRIVNGTLTELRDRHGNTVARYFENTNLTYDNQNRLVGRGDQTMRMLRD